MLKLSRMKLHASWEIHKLHGLTLAGLHGADYEPF